MTVTLPSIRSCRRPGAAAAETILVWLDRFLEHLGRLGADLSSAELTDLDRVVERKLFNLDRQEIQEQTDGSDDGFLCCRGFMAVLDAQCEAMCYFFENLHRERFGDHSAGW